MSREQLTEFLRHFCFTNRADQSVNELLERTGDSHKRALKDVDAPVKAVVEFLDSTIGTTFTKACNQSDANLLGLDFQSGEGH
eukprot:6172516-Pleurochrysis_carterae.AAC.1